MWSGPPGSRLAGLPGVRWVVRLSRCTRSDKIEARRRFVGCAAEWRQLEAVMLILSFASLGDSSHVGQVASALRRFALLSHAVPFRMKFAFRVAD
eukprot:2008090-Amphidinium_carterae.1